MSELFSIGTSALIANQRLLSTAGHNIANANTDGYSRQRVTLSQRPPQYIGVGFVGKGVDIASITRNASDFLTDNVRFSASGQARAATYADLSTQVDGLLSDGTFSPAVQKFFNSLQDAANDPSSTAARQVLLNSANNLTDRFQDLHNRFNAIAKNVNDELASKVDKLNTLATAVAGLNKQIVQSYGIASGGAPNDLLDQRDVLLKNISELVNINVAPQSDGGVNVFIGNGQLLVASEQTNQIKVTPNVLDGSRKEISVVKANGSGVITDSISGGELAGVLQFRDQVLEPARNAIGRLAVVLSESYNAQHQTGVDLSGTRGAAMFNYGSPIVNAGATNSGAMAVAIDAVNLPNLTTSDYSLTYDGTNYTLERLDTGATRTFPGGAAFTADGLSFTPSGTAAAGDSYRIMPTKYAGRSIDVRVTDPARLALAGPVRATTTLANIGNAKISAPTILDSTDAALQTSVQLVFNTPPTTYQVNGTGALIPFNNGGNIDINGWRVQISGTPAAGDTFQVTSNTNAKGDNTNALALLNLRLKGIMDGSTATYQDAYNQTLGQVGSLTQQAEISRDSLKVTLSNAEAARDQVAGVNLDEEAADLVRYQQAYQGAAQIVSAANQAFQALLDALRR